MKKVLLFGLSAVMALSASAQFTSGGTTETTNQRTSLADQMGNSRSFSEKKDYSGRFNLGYNMWGLNPSEGDGLSFNGFFVEWLDAVSVSTTLPLYFDWGFNANYNHYGNDENNVKSTRNMFQLAVPLQVEYRLPVGDSFHISPFLGLIARVNILANGSMEYEVGSKTQKFDVNYFDKDDMGSSEACWKRFQLGWNIGVNLDIKKFTIGLSYGTDFMEIAKKVHSSTFKVGIGVNY